MEEKTKTTVEERLSKATECYKELKTKYDELESKLSQANKKIEEYENGGTSSDSALVERVRELEAEIAINGSSANEIKELNSRLEKAKEIFKEQKDKIAEIKGINKELQNELAASDKTCKKLSSELEQKSQLLAESDERASKYYAVITAIQKNVAGL